MRFPRSMRPTRLSPPGCATSGRAPRAHLILAGTLLASLAAACQGAVPSPTPDFNSAQAMLDLSQSLVTLREENAGLQAQVDSLRGALAYQDTVLRQLAAAAGVPMRPQAITFPQ
jgi:hypothetical protein